MIYGYEEESSHVDISRTCKMSTISHDSIQVNKFMVYTSKTTFMLLNAHCSNSAYTSPSLSSFHPSSYFVFSNLAPFQTPSTRLASARHGAHHASLHRRNLHGANLIALNMRFCSRVKLMSSSGPPDGAVS